MPDIFSKIKVLYNFWQNHWSEENTGRDQRFSALLIRLISVVFLYMVFDTILMRIGHLPFESYEQSFIYLAFLRHLLTGWYLVFVPVLVFIFIIFRKNLLISWPEIPKGGYLRFFIVLTAGILTWITTTFNYNLYFDQGYYFDRLLLFIFLLLIYWKPVFVLPFLTCLLPFIWQITVLPTSAWTAFYLPIRVLVLFWSFFFLYLLTKKFAVADLVFMTGCLFAAHYWISGYGKFSWDWIGYDQIYFLLPATYTNGWMSFVSPGTMSRITNFSSYFNLPLKIFTLLVEFGAFLFFLNRQTVRFFLGGWIVLHTGIFFMSGIFFWPWLVLEIVLLFLFLIKDGFAELPLFSPKHLIISIVLIITGTFWSKPVKLAWFDVPVNYTYQIEASTEKGKSFRLPPNFFAPFDTQFTLGGFSYLSSETIMPITWGVTPDPFIARNLSELESADEVFEFETVNGKIYTDKKQKELFDKFLKRFFQNWNKRNSNRTFLSYLKAPRIICTYPTYIDLKGEKKIKKIEVIKITTFYKNGLYKEIRKNKVHEISID